MTHYLDNSSTTQPSRTAIDAMNRAAEVTWGNPSSTHAVGMAANAVLTESRGAIRKALGLPRFSGDKVIFTSSGTEANNLAILGTARAKNRVGRIIISDGEHPSVENPAMLLEREGFEVVKIPTVGGILDLGRLKEVLSDREKLVILAAFMLVNNETGALYDVKSAAKLVKTAYPDATVHCDAVQAFTKVKFTPTALGADTLSVSAHKIHSVRGAAALFVSADVIKRKNLTAVMPGGGQEEGYRSGTENLPAIAAFAAATEEAMAKFDAHREKIGGLRAYLDQRLAELPVEYNLPHKGIPDVANIIVPGIRSETVLNYLSSKGVMVSAGSACSARSKHKSPALTAFGTSPDRIDSSIRVSLSYTNDESDIDALVEGLGEAMGSLQRK